MANFDDTELFTLLMHRFGMKDTVMYYLRKAHSAKQRAKVAIADKNIDGAITEAQTVFDNVDMLYRLLADEDRSKELGKQSNEDDAPKK